MSSSSKAPILSTSKPFTFALFTPISKSNRRASSNAERLSVSSELRGRSQQTPQWDGLIHSAFERIIAQISSWMWRFSSRTWHGSLRTRNRAISSFTTQRSLVITQLIIASKECKVYFCNSPIFPFKKIRLRVCKRRQR